MPLSIEPLLSKSHAQVEIVAGADTVLVLTKVVGTFKQTVLAVIAITGFGKTVIVWVFILKHPEEFVTV